MPRGIFKNGNSGFFKKGRKNPQDEIYRKKISDALKGRKFSAEHKKNISDAHKKMKPTEKQLSTLRTNWIGRKHSEETKLKMSKSMRGKPHLKSRGANHPSWKGGITPINQKIRQSLEYVIWRRAVFERDNYTCIWCGDNRGHNLNADHIKPFAYYPELRFAIDNGRTLCEPCHRTTDTYLKKLKPNEC